MHGTVLMLSHTSSSIGTYLITRTTVLSERWLVYIGSIIVIMVNNPPFRYYNGYSYNNAKSFRNARNVGYVAKSGFLCSSVYEQACMCACIYVLFMYVSVCIMFICLYVCMHICMHACVYMYVRMYVCNWNVRSLCRIGAIKSVVGELEKYKLDLVGVQKVKWEGEGC
jgi:hypothetical protein